jgi:hypothetical protein
MMPWILHETFFGTLRRRASSGMLDDGSTYSTSAANSVLAFGFGLWEKNKIKAKNAKLPKKPSRLSPPQSPKRAHPRALGHHTPHTHT